MAPGDTKFSHITVNADDDDEFVIQAGVPSVQDDAVAPVVPVAEESVSQAATPVDSEQTEKSDVEQADKVSSTHAETDYRQTTVDDLKAEPMSVTQKVVIAAAVVLIVGFIVFNVFMR